VAACFENVIATDASEQQIASAEPHPNIVFRVATAEASGILAGTVDLVTVAQALHWFDIQRFFEEAMRVLKPGGVLAVWSYERCRVSPGCNEVIERVFAEVEDFWPPERQIVEDHYRGIVLPMPEMPVDAFEMELEWRADEMLNYMRTWSATQRYKESRKEDPVGLYAQDLGDQWGTGSRKVSWPLTLRVGRKAESS